MGSDSTDKASAWTASHAINLHKLLVTPITAGLMWYYSCYTPAAWVYLSLHGTYSLLWLIKEACFPDKTFREPEPFGQVAFIFVFLNITYYSIPWALCYHAKAVPVWFPAIAVAVFGTGMFLMTGSDCQKYYTLKAQPGKLITTGFFKHIRSPNYLGELLIYTAFSMLTYTPWGYFGNLCFVLLGIIPNLTKKDKSMSRYPEFEAYQASTWAIMPPFY